MESFDNGSRSLAGYHEYDDEPWGSIIGWKLLDQLNDY
jgi:hypothetical protein